MGAERMSDARLLFVTLSNIGDLVLTTPALVALHAAYPGHLVDIVADPRSSDLLLACPFIGTLYHRHKRAGWRGWLALLDELRARRYEAIVDLRTDFLPWLLRARRRSARWQARPRGPHAAEQHHAVVRRVLPGRDATIPPAVLWHAEGDRATADRLLGKLPGDRWLALAPGANWPGKIWPVERFVELVASLDNRFDGVVILGAHADREVAASLAAQSALPALDLAGRTSLPVAAAVLARAAAFVGNDSGLGHLAAAVATPTLTVFGPGRPDRYRPWGDAAVVVLAPDLDLRRLPARDVAARLVTHIESVRPRRGTP